MLGAGQQAQLLVGRLPLIDATRDPAADKVGAGQSASKLDIDQNGAIAGGGDAVGAKIRRQLDAAGPGQHRHIAPRIQREDLDAFKRPMRDRVKMIGAGNGTRAKHQAVGVDHRNIGRRGAIGIELAVGPRLAGVKWARGICCRINKTDAAALAHAAGHQPLAGADLQNVFGLVQATEEIQPHGGRAVAGALGDGAFRLRGGGRRQRQKSQNGKASLHGSLPFGGRLAYLAAGRDVSMAAKSAR